jgi:predicted RNA binding protein YcfA (HicA-like mRNA interferase family)
MAALLRAGFIFKRQEGSHMILRREQPFVQVSVPDHKELDKGTLRSILRYAGISVDQLLELL